MRKITFIAALLAVTFMNAQNYQFETDGNNEGWAAVNTEDVNGDDGDTVDDTAVAGGIYTLDTDTGSSSKIRLGDGITTVFAAASYTYCHVELGAFGGHDQLRLAFVSTSESVPPTGGKNQGTTGNEVVDIELNHANWTDNIVQIDLVPRDTGASNSATGGLVEFKQIVFDNNTALFMKTVDVIPGATVNAANGNIMVNGANLDAVYNVTGQQVGSKGLASGIYIVKISKNGTVAAVKVAL
ncbi:hypothetical protein [Wenyingzhuangia fucanilytica]|nr:hypothetical protein [Wenyingzhuangia fucanilytica]